MPGPPNRSPEIVSLGEPLVEFSAAVPGALSAVSHFKSGCGGDTSNFAVAVSRLGGRAGYVSRIGCDPLAEILINCWTAEGVDHCCVARDPDAPTGIYFTSRQGDRHHFTYYRHASAASRMDPEDLPVDYIRRARWLHVSGISQAISASAAQTVVKAVAVARQAGLCISYDPNLRLQLWSIDAAREMTHRLAPLIDIMLPSYEDACCLTGQTDPEQIARYYLSLGLRVVVLKMGVEGALLAEAPPPADRGAITIQKFPGFTVHAIDASGAGDTFDAAFAVARLEGRPAADCVRFANAAGALVTTGIGAVTPIPHREAVVALLNRMA